MRRSALCVLVVLLLCFASMPKPVLAQGPESVNKGASRREVL
jgi:hypothetical protein